MNIWIDSRLPISLLTLDDLKKTERRAGINLKQDDIEDAGNNRIKMLGRMELELASNGWKTKAEVRVIGGTRPSIVGRNLMGKLGLQLMQADPRRAVMNIQGTDDSSCEKEQIGESEDEQMDPWQQYFSKLFPKILLGSGKLETTRFKRYFSKISYQCSRRAGECR